MGSSGRLPDESTGSLHDNPPGDIQPRLLPTLFEVKNPHGPGAANRRELPPIGADGVIKGRWMRRVGERSGWTGLDLVGFGWTRLDWSDGERELWIGGTAM